VAATEQNGQHDGQGGTRLDNRFGMDMYVESGKFFSEQASIDCRIVAIGHERRTRSSREQPVKSTIDCHGQLLWLYVVVICRGHMRWNSAAAQWTTRSGVKVEMHIMLAICVLALQDRAKVIVSHGRTTSSRCIAALHLRVALPHYIVALHCRVTILRHIVASHCWDT
jgi:hypothetical protein